MISLKYNLSFEKLQLLSLNWSLNCFGDIPYRRKVEEEELRVTDWEILKGFVASGVEPRGIELVNDFYENYKKIYDQEFKQNGYFKIIKRSPLYICKK